jgi:CopG family transcriptional regulator, nickel-responsive regulator
MQRVTITLDDDLLAEIDRLVAARGYQGRSEAIRDLARAGLLETALEQGRTGSCVAAIVYVYDHAARELSRRLTSAFHDRHDLSLTTLHVHLDHDSCMEVAVLRGDAEDVRDVASKVVAERGVRYGRTVLVPVDRAVEAHAHGAGAGDEHPHEHLHVRTGK